MITKNLIFLDENQKLKGRKKILKSDQFLEKLFEEKTF